VRRALRSLFGDTAWWKHVGVFLSIPLSLRFLNWFVQHCVHRTRGLGFSVHFTSRVISAANIKLGENVWYQFAQSGGCYVQALNGVEIGDDTLIAPGVKIVSASHDLSDHQSHGSTGPIRIGDRCWLGANAVILPGVELGDEVVVAAGSVVTKSFPARTIVAGVPAAAVGSLDFDGPIQPLARS